jgi:hypothetical protein
MAIDEPFKASSLSISSEFQHKTPTRKPPPADLALCSLYLFAYYTHIFLLSLDIPAYISAFRLMGRLGFLYVFFVCLCFRKTVFFFSSIYGVIFGRVILAGRETEAGEQKNPQCSVVV